MFIIVFAIIVICIVLTAYEYIRQKPEREAKEKEEAKQREEFAKKLKDVWDEI